MSGRHPISKLRKKMKPERLKRLNQKAAFTAQEIAMSSLRKLAGQTQESVAATLNKAQATISGIENQEDMRISTLKSWVEAIHGELMIRVRLEDGSEYQLSQLTKASTG